MSDKSRQNKAIKEKLIEVLGENLRCFGFQNDKPCNNKDLTVSHMFKSNTAATIKRTSGKVFDYSDYQNTIPLCRTCHDIYEDLPATRQDTILSKNVELTRLEWLEKAIEIHNYGKVFKCLVNHAYRFKWFINQSSKAEVKTYD